MHQLATDLRLAFRRARKRPGFTIVALLSLTLGIGANTAVFSLVNAILLRTAPIPHPEQIAEIYQQQTDFPYAPFSYPDYVDFRRATARTFSQISISHVHRRRARPGRSRRVAHGRAGERRLLPAARPSARGRPPARPAGRRHAGRASRSWSSRTTTGSARSPAIRSAVGRTMRLSGHQYTIVGVAPAVVHGNGQRHRAGGVRADP